MKELDYFEVKRVQGGAVSACEFAFTASYGLVGASFGALAGPAGAWGGWAAGSAFGSTLAQFACK